MKKFSIIIPVYNNWNYTSACLKSIYDFSGFPSKDYEVLVVDDDSEDGTSLKIKEFTDSNSNLRYINNARNLGFAGTCNHGAAIAQGEYLVFLNNDTRVTNDWDVNLINTIEKDRDTWIVGAKCIYPDGTIQHAGVAFPEFFQNHIGHIFKEAPRYFPLANVEREFQCVTAACFIIRKEDFIGLGGFDEEYRNGFEDVDLCLRVKSNGKKIVYQPSSEIIHYESRSEGRLESMNFNKTVLLRKWQNFIMPDEFKQSQDILKLALDSGLLVPLQIFQQDGFRKGLTIHGNFKYTVPGGIKFTPTWHVNKIVLQKPESIDKDFLLIKGELMSNGPGLLKLKYLTHQEEFYSESKSFKFRIYKGNNIFHFTVFAKYIQQDLLLEFCKFSAGCEVKTLELYAFDNGIPREKPSLALLCHISENTGYYRTISTILQSDFLSGFNVDVLLTYEKGLSPEAEFFQASTDHHKIVTKSCSYKDLPAIMNDFLSGSSSKYVAVFTDGVHMPAGRMERFIELMESNPALSVIHPGIEGLIIKEQPGVLDGSTTPLFSLRGRTDMPVFFRRVCWEEIGGFDTTIPYYYNMDLCLTILATHNWKSQCLEGIRSQSFRETLQIPGLLKPEIEIIRNDFYNKHSNYLLEIALRAGQYNILKLKANELRLRKSRNNPHATLLGSIRVHMRHFMRRFYKPVHVILK